MLHTTLLYVHCVQYARQYYTYCTAVCIQHCNMLCGVPNTEYGRIGFPIPALEGITLVSSTIKLGQVGYIRRCLILHSITHTSHMHTVDLY